MKKLLTLSAVFVAAALFFTGCTQPTNPTGNTNPGPGNWSTTANWLSGSDSPVFKNSDGSISCGSVTIDGQGGAVYTNTNPRETKTGSAALTENQFRNSAYRFMSDLDITGFEATAKCTSTASTCGFKFNVSSDWLNLYELFIQGNQFYLKKRINNSTSTIQNWTTSSAINAEPGENKVTVYKDGNAIKIFINGTNVYTINNPELTSGSVAFICGLGYADIQNQTNITATYKITNLQR